jgi:hypothetical protein
MSTGDAEDGALGRALRSALLVSTGVLAVACGSAPSQTFHPGGGGSSAPVSTPAPASSDSGGTGAAPLALPPFGKNAHVVMTSWLPASASEIPAVTTAKDFLLAVLYADYTGGRDHRWRGYVSAGKVRAGLASTLAQPGVTTESFRGTVRFWHMSALATPGPKGTIEVTECVDSSRARNTSLATGKVLPRRRQVPADQNFYSNSDVLAKDSGGHWRVISIPPTIYYPRALECKE